MPTMLLMENAGRGAAEALVHRLAGDAPRNRPPRVFIACGPGNNGGDGGVVARHLDLWGVAVKVVWFTDPARLRGDAALQWAILDRAGLDQSALPGPIDPAALPPLLHDADWIVDALLGTGLTRAVEGPLRTVIDALNASGNPILALDLPSGLDADTGVPLGTAVRAAVTTTFVAPKLGFNAPSASVYTGEVEVIDIGAPRTLLEAAGVIAPGRPPDDEPRS